MTTPHGLGWLPDVPKANDYTLDHAEVAPLLERTNLAPHIDRSPALRGRSGGVVKEGGLATAPSKVDLRLWFSPIEDQGQLGSCTANAAIALLEYFERRATAKFIDASRLFLYKTERNLLGWTGDTGAYLRTAMEALVLFGAPPERYWPYDGRAAPSNSHYDIEPTSFCYAFANNYKAIKYFRLDPSGVNNAQVLTNIKLFTAAGFPSMFGLPVYSEYDQPIEGGLVAYPGPGSHYRGGHANVVVGYDDNLTIGADRGALLIRNSWGPEWGNGGYGWLSYRYVTQGLAVDWWTMISGVWVETKQF